MLGFSFTNHPLCLFIQGTLETKSGPVQNLVVHDVTRFYHKDLIVGDATGRLTVFCDSQILSRQTISSHSINCVQVLQDASKLA